jgi:sulfatase modifying factor 1
VCAAGVCGSPPSCSGLSKTCGARRTEDCCTWNVVPGDPGDPFNRRGDPSFPATVGDFRLDRFEVTVGRFRQLVAVYEQQMTVTGSGINPNNHNPGQDTGWDPTWNINKMPMDGTLAMSLRCDTAHQSGTDSAGANETLPINCVNWFEAEAFCIWMAADCRPRLNGTTRPQPAKNSAFIHGAAPSPPVATQIFWERQASPTTA